MTVTKDDFEKIWASTSPLTPYSFSDAQYKEGWNFVGSTPPSRQMWDAFMQNADEKLKYLYQHEDIPLGHEYFTFNPNVPQGSLPLFGGEYDRETYSDLWNWVQEQTGYLKTEAEWQTLSASNNGNVPYYSDGDGSTTFRIPSLKCWIKSANGTASEVGSYLEAGLPNITGTYNKTSGGGFLLNAGLSETSASGALYASSTSTTGYASTTGSIDAVRGIGINASLSNSIYGNSTTVQPPSIVGMWLVKAYGVIVDTGSINEQAYIDDRFNASKQYTDDKIAPIGTAYFGEWIASSSSAVNTVLTRSIDNVPIGTYLAIVKAPEMNIANSLVNASFNGCSFVGGNGMPIIYLSSETSGSFVVKVTNAVNFIAAVSGQSANVTFSSIERGGLTLVRISG